MCSSKERVQMSVVNVEEEYLPIKNQNIHSRLRSFSDLSGTVAKISIQANWTKKKSEIKY